MASKSLRVSWWGPGQNLRMQGVEPWKFADFNIFECLWKALCYLIILRQINYFWNIQSLSGWIYNSFVSMLNVYHAKHGVSILTFHNFALFHCHINLKSYIIINDNDAINYLLWHQQWSQKTGTFFLGVNFIFSQCHFSTHQIGTCFLVANTSCKELCLYGANQSTIS